MYILYIYILYIYLRVALNTYIYIIDTYVSIYNIYIAAAVATETERALHSIGTLWRTIIGHDLIFKDVPGIALPWHLI